MSNNKRIEYIDLFRGFGIILMVMGHIGFGSVFDHFIHAFHMPMFFFVSGLFFKKKDNALWEIVVYKSKTLLLPYILFGSLYAILYSVIHGGFTVAILKSLIWVNTEFFPIAGALWFLTALYFTEIIYCVIDRYIPSMKIKTLLVALIAFLGNIATLVIPFRLPWALDAAFVGLGLYHIARLIKEYSNKLTQALVNIPLGINIVLGGGTCILIFLNGYVNMRNGTYDIIPLFWINAILSILVGMNFARFINNILGVKYGVIINWIKYIGRNSMTFVCLNQVVIKVLKRILEKLFSMNILLEHLLVLAITLVTLVLMDYIIRKTKLKVIIGK